MSRESWVAGACSVRSSDVSEPAYGTAARATSWVALEQNGPWGRRAAVDSRLDPTLGAWLDGTVAGEGGRFVLVRSPSAHADPHDSPSHQVLLACCRPGRSWLLTGRVADPERLRGLDLAALDAGDRDAVVRSLPEVGPVDEPHLLVCTNGRRDVCCAVRGRPVAQAADLAHPGRVWETSHTGGHRFAPTAVLLPSGQTLARLEATDAVEALEAAATGEIPEHLLGPVHDRGLSTYHPAVQAAVSTVRADAGTVRWDDLDARLIDDLHTAEDSWQVLVEHRDGRVWRLQVSRTTEGPSRPASCGKADSSVTRHVVQALPGSADVVG